jgi:hypothetical protein
MSDNPSADLWNNLGKKEIQQQSVVAKLLEEILTEIKTIKKELKNEKTK